ncbi:hypothetical protein NF702_00050 [Lactococcus petauri]|uniref:hypothetical protein n=1 Tax=Lactococcus TaxID=1357 RepID=UPI0018E0C7C7|nr:MULTISPECIES: hypothetical protein [Lactococcus]MDG6135638.1 hypothetical protein [Lactococcus petauri]QQC58117.1 hypothetical protein I6I19_03640 [Lactococcus garvieae]UHU65325.1 hypothetical protein C9I44_02335 [Lactococcus garvieae]USI71050.1 hypothetical protein LMJ99_03820 [Lactococcus garvieae subsp. garvieae]
MVSFSEVLRDYYLERAGRVCSGVTVEHYERWKQFQEKNNLRTDPVKFIRDLTKMSREEVTNRIFPWHMETVNGKRVRVEDHFDLIPAPPLKR